MEPCTVETGLLRKKPCGQAAVAKCTNCERPLCSQHAVVQLSATKQRTGSFICRECDVAQREAEKGVAAVARSGAASSHPPAKKPAEKPKAPVPKDAPSEGSGGIDFKPGGADKK